MVVGLMSGQHLLSTVTLDDKWSPSQL